VSKLPHLAALILTLGAACDSERARSSRGDVVARKTIEANDAFESHKALRALGLRSERAMIGTSPAMISSLAVQLPLTAGSRADVEDAITKLQIQLDEAATAIDRVQDATAEQWKARDTAAEDAMKQLEAARDHAWNSLKNAQRTDASS
jgi:hypothetical protein